MNLFLIILVIAIIVTEIKVNDYDWSFTGVLIGLVLGLFWAFLIGGSLTGLIAWKIAPQPQCKQTTRYPLAALRDGVTEQGSFFLGTGYIDGNLQYFYYQQMPDSGFQAQKISYSSVEVFQDEQNKPYIINGEIYYPNKFWNAVAWSWWLTCTSEIHVPKGSIIQNYTLNLGK